MNKTLDKLFSSRWFRHSKFRRQTLMGQYGPYFGMSDREKIISLALRFVKNNRVPGNYFEFGCGSGYTLGNAMTFSKHLGLNDMKFYAFDSFKGIPKTKDIDISDQFVEGDYACDSKTFLKNLPTTKNVTLVEGFYDNTLTSELKSKVDGSASIVWVDCDLYWSTVPVLSWITEYLVDGSLLIFDDWFCFKGNPAKGEQQAFREWEAANKFLKLSPWLPFGWHGMSFVVTR